MTKELENFILELHAKGLDEEEIYNYLQKQDIPEKYDAFDIVDTLHTQQVIKDVKSISIGQVLIRIWGVICLGLGLALLGLAVYRLFAGSPSFSPFIYGGLLCYAGFTLIINPHLAFTKMD